MIVLKMEETEGKKITIDLSRGGDTTERVENVILMSKRPYLTQWHKMKHEWKYACCDALSHSVEAVASISN